MASFLLTRSAARKLELKPLKTTSPIEALDLVVYFVDLRFNQPNFNAYKQLELLLLHALAVLASNDFADKIEYLKLLTMTVIVSSCYYKKSVFQQSNELDLNKSLRGLRLRTAKLHSLSARFLAHPLFGSLRGR